MCHLAAKYLKLAVCNQHKLLAYTSVTYISGSVQVKVTRVTMVT